MLPLLTSVSAAPPAASDDGLLVSIAVALAATAVAALGSVAVPAMRSITARRTAPAQV